MRTKNGRAVTDEKLDQMVEEAEAGFDLSDWVPRAEGAEADLTGEDSPYLDETTRRVSIFDLARAFDFADNSCGRVDCMTHIDETLAQYGPSVLATNVFWRLPYESSGATKPVTEVALASVLVALEGQWDGEAGLYEALRNDDPYTHLAALVFDNLPD
jgi:hypothetical protein